MPILPNTKDESLNKFLSAQNSENTALVNKFNSVSGHKHTGAAGDGPILPAFDASTGHKHTGAAGDAPNIDSANVKFASGVSGFTPVTVAAALDALAGSRLIESGSNANGEYFKYEDGRLVCQRIITSANISATGWTVTTITFPAAFISAPTPIVFQDNSGSGDIAVTVLRVLKGSLTGTGFQLDAYVQTVAISGTVKFHCLAVGRWK